MLRQSISTSLADTSSVVVALARSSKYASLQNVLGFPAALHILE
jgi:hypothetical protein